ncbi:MAG: hypothetical protein IJ109_04245 [Firmicutes bacterium]|nr:hypothetical protein [Bacillota bacterium]
MSLRKLQHKFIAVLLAVALAITMIPSLSFAAEGDSGDSMKYVSMNVPYRDFYAPYNLTDAAIWEVAPGIDAVSTATTTKFMGTTGLANGTWNDGSYIRGVKIPVAVSEADYAKLTAGLTENDPYYFTDLAESPSYYSTLQIGDGSYQFSAIQKSQINTTYLGLGDLDDDDNSVFVPGAVDLDDGYGDYQLTIKGISNTDRTIQTDADTYEVCTIYGAILNTADGTYGMTALENLWFGSRRPNVEIAWSVPGGQNLKRGHGKGDVYYQFKDLNGATLTGVTLITNLGVIDINQEVQCAKYYDGDLSNLSLSISSDAAVLNVSGIPAELKDVTVTVDNLGGGAVESDQVALKRKPSDGVSYTVTISSSNYPDITRTVSTPISQSQKEELKALTTKAQATSGYDTNADLKEHVQEAVELLNTADATSYEAATLIGELQEKIKKTYPVLNLSAALNGSVLSLTLSDGVKFTDLVNPTYTLSIPEGRRSTVFASGALTGLATTLAAAPEIGTEYTLSIVTDNYQDFSGTVVAQEEAKQEEVKQEEVKQEAGKQEAVKQKAANPMTVKTVAKTLKAKKLKKKAQSFKALTVSKAQGKVTYTAKAVNAKSKKALKFSKGKITVKKGTKKGTYKIKVTVKAAGSNNYKAASIAKTITVKVK